MAKTFGYGSVLIVTTTTGELNLGQVRSISGPGVSFNDVDTTCLDSSSNYRTFVAGLGDPGEVTFSVVYDSSATISHSRLNYYMNQRSSKMWIIAHGSTAGDVDTFSGYIKGLSREIPMDDVVTADYTIKVSGLPGYTTG